jgi:glyoxylase-like metal-dependent hydrolase (beta-lactamase superfamily II)
MTVAMGPRYEIVAVRYGRAQSRKSELFYRFGAYGEDDAPQAMDFFFYVLRDGARTVLVDCGFDPAKAAARGRDCLIAPREALARLGVRPADVAQLLVTHLHWDHVGNLDQFGDTMLIVPQAELDFWSAPVARNVQFWSHVDDDGIGDVLAAQREGRVVATGDDGVVVPGIRAITVGGHSAGQQVLVVETARGPVVLASDAAHLYEELELARPFSVAVDLKAMCEAYALLDRLRVDDGALVVPGHDPEVATRFPSLGGDADGFAFQIA